jgi:hypothetical protein
MSFAVLPAIFLSWDASAEPLSTFLRYQVYRRVAGDTDWTKMARITDRSLTTWTDYEIEGLVVYDYAVTVVADVSGEEIESAFPTAVQSLVTINSLFLHDQAAPEHYVQMAVQADTIAPQQVMTFVQPRGQSDPIAHVGRTLSKQLSFSFTGQWTATDSTRNSDVWDALEELQLRQQTNGSTLVCRTTRGVFAYCVITDMPRTDQPMQYGVSLKLQRVKAPAGVA